MKKSLTRQVHEKLKGETEIIDNRGGKSYCGNCGYIVDDGADPEIIAITTNDGVARALCPKCRYDLYTGKDCSALEQGEDYEVGW